MHRQPPSNVIRVGHDQLLCLLSHCSHAMENSGGHSDRRSAEVRRDLPPQKSIVVEELKIKNHKYSIPLQETMRGM
jgi:hypothetical protein